MQALYAYFKQSGESSIKKSEQELIFSIQKTYDLYHYLLILIINIADYAKTRIDLAKQKHIPSDEDLHPNSKFIDNSFIKQLRTNTQLLHYLNAKKLSWINYPEFIKGLYLKMTESEDYKNYMSAEEKSYKDDKIFICKLYKNIIAPFDPLYQNLEEQSIYWNDEPEFIIGIIIKTIKKFKEKDSENAVLMPLFKNADDKEFSGKLFRKVVLNYEIYLELIKKFSKNWDVERIAFLDILLMQMAIGEVIEFPSIPVKVTLNEYLEIAKYYSTAKSNIFLNGILDKVFAHLKDNKMINKQGRGLIGDA